MKDSNFASIPILDSHVHFIHPERLDEVWKLLHEAGCHRANLVCIPEVDGSTHNAAALHFKCQYPDAIYISGALDYRPALAAPDTASTLLAQQVLLLKNIGFDGLKMIEGKPQVRKLLPYPLDSGLYVDLWAKLETEHFPVVLHIADPDEFWDTEKCPDWARQNGWDYSDGSYPSKEELYQEVNHILEVHSDLRIVLAHFGFLSGDLSRAGRLLEAHPFVYFDLAPHIGMYHDFNRQPQTARDFFVRFQDRILYGTDTDTRTLLRGEDGVGYCRYIPRLIRSFLERKGLFSLPGFGEVQGLGLPYEILRKVYFENFQHIFGINPAPLRRSYGSSDNQ